MTFNYRYFILLKTYNIWSGCYTKHVIIISHGYFLF